MLDASTRYVIPPIEIFTCRKSRKTFPQITQIDADVFLCVDLRYLRHLRADLGGWIDYRVFRIEYR